ncbi:MAG: hypothetical protein HYV96_11110 [Opitutae bacterium]|nr:hypothetical protein [Opitutae bacterium]
MSTTLTNSISAEVNAAVAGITVIDRAQPVATQDTSDTPKVTSVGATSNPKADRFCTRYAHLIAEYGDPISFNDNDTMSLNEMLFAAKFAEDQDVIFSPEENRFYAYDPKTGLWSTLTEGGLRLKIHRDVFAVAKAEGIAIEMGFKLTNRQLTALTNLLKGFCERRDAFSTAHNLIHLRNGMLDLSTGTPTLLPFAPDYYSRNQIPFVYNPTAACPRFIGDLLKPALPDDDIDLLQRWAGSVLLGGDRAQRFLIMHGLAGGGKSTLISVIESLIGEHNIATLRPSLLAESRFETSRFISKTLLVGKDVRSDFLSDKAISYLKSLTGGDRMTAELKGSNEVVQIRGNFALVITANALPKLTLDNDADAWRRRLLVVPFTGKKPATPVPDFAGVLAREEGEGILAWMVEGAMKHLAELKSRGSFILTPTQQARIDGMLAESNSVEEFVKANVITSKIHDLSGDEMLSAYEKHCQKLDWAPVSAQAFRTKVKQVMLEKFGLTQSHDLIRYEQTVRGFRGVTLKFVPSTTPTATSSIDDLPF